MYCSFVFFSRHISFSSRIPGILLLLLASNRYVDFIYTGLLQHLPAPIFLFSSSPPEQPPAAVFQVFCCCCWPQTGTLILFTLACCSISPPIFLFSSSPPEQPPAAPEQPPAAVVLFLFRSPELPPNIFIQQQSPPRSSLPPQLSCIIFIQKSGAASRRRSCIFYSAVRSSFFKSFLIANPKMIRTFLIVNQF